MNNCVYDVDLTKPVTPIIVRDAIVKCFLNAHRAVLEQMKEVQNFKSNKEFNEMKKINVKFLIEQTFSDVGGDYENPTKESILKVVEKLKKFAVNFRSPKIVDRHAGQIGEIIKKLP